MVNKHIIFSLLPQGAGVYICSICIAYYFAAMQIHIRSQIDPAFFQHVNALEHSFYHQELCRGWLYDHIYWPQHGTVPDVQNQSMFPFPSRRRNSTKANRMDMTVRTATIRSVILLA